MSLQLPWWGVHFALALFATPFLVAPQPLLKWAALACFAVNAVGLAREL